MSTFVTSPSSRAAARSCALLTSVLTSVLASVLVQGCSDDAADSRHLSELSDADHVATCERARTEIGADAATGERAYACFQSASSITGTCNATIFGNCVTQPATACLAPAAADPLRTCEATVGQWLECKIALGRQYAAFRGVSCAAPPAAMPRAAAALGECGELCAACPSLPGC